MDIIKSQLKTAQAKVKGQMSCLKELRTTVMQLKKAAGRQGKDAAAAQSAALTAAAVIHNNAMKAASGLRTAAIKAAAAAAAASSTELLDAQARITQLTADAEVMRMTLHDQKELAVQTVATAKAETAQAQATADTAKCELHRTALRGAAFEPQLMSMQQQLAASQAEAHAWRVQAGSLLDRMMQLPAAPLGPQSLNLEQLRAIANILRNQPG
jgi:hypothetical protein